VSRRWKLALAVCGASAAVVAIVGGIAYGPDPTSPPASWDRFARDWTRTVLPVLYWVGGVVMLAAYQILHWQRSTPESAAARWNRRKTLSLSITLLTLAVGQTVLRDWQAVGFAAAVTLLLGVLFALGVALTVTYVVPIVRCRGGRCVAETEPADAGGVLPKPPEVWDGNDRRVGPKDRRRIQA
jgi:hypothetical protein